jgi:fructokinase
MEACKVPSLKDSAGAGDWCTAGIIHMLGQRGIAGLNAVKGTDLKHALEFGQALAAWNCQYEGARGGMYLIDKRSFHQAVNHILFGTALEISNNGNKVKAAPQFVKCLAPKCNMPRTRERTANGFVIPERPRRVIAGTA